MQRGHLLAATSRLATGGGVAHAASCPARQAWKTRPHRLVSGVVGLCRRFGEKGGEETGPNPVDRGRPGSKRHLLVDGDGLPLSVILTGANVHDSKVFEQNHRGRGADPESERRDLKATRQASCRQGATTSRAAEASFGSAA